MRVNEESQQPRIFKDEGYKAKIKLAGLKHPPLLWSKRQ